MIKPTQNQQNEKHDLSIDLEEVEVRTKDTKRILKNGDGAFYIEGAYEWWDSWLRMIIDCFKSGMNKEEIFEALDIDNDGNIYWTTYEQ